MWKIPSAGENMEQLEFSNTPSWEYKLLQSTTWENCLTVSIQAEHVHSLWSQKFLHGLYLTEMYPNVHNRDALERSQQHYF